MQSRAIVANTRARARAGAALLLLALACSASDPIEAIRQRQAAGDYASTLEPLRKLLEERRGEAEVHYLYGAALVGTGQASLAEWALRVAMDDPQWLVPAGLQLSIAALATSNFSLAIDVLDRILAEHPEQPDALLLRASAHAHSRLDPEAALADARSVLDLDPDNIEAMEPRILALLQLEREEDARQALEELGERIQAKGADDPLAGWHCATSAIFADDSGHEDEARERWEDCLERFPGHSNVVMKSIRFFDRRSEFERSLDILRAAQRADGASRTFRVLLGVRLRAASLAGEAEALLLAATRDAPAEQRAAAFLDLSKHYQELGRDDDAVRAVDRAVEIARAIGEPDPRVILEQADAKLLAGDFESALAIADGMKVAAHRAVIRARVAQERGDDRRALELFDEALRLWPDNPWAHEYAAHAAEAVGDFDRALDEYRQALRIAPGETGARNRAAQILLAEGKPLEALMMLGVKVEEAPLDDEGLRLRARALAQAGQGAPLKATLERARSQPRGFGALVSSAAQGAHDLGGPGVAVRALREWESQGLVDFRQPTQADALRALVRFSVDPVARASARTSVDAALRAHPEEGAFHEILGRALEIEGAPLGARRAAFERALELAPNDARALAGLGTAWLEEDPERALTLLEKAAGVPPPDAEIHLEAARAYQAAGRIAEARRHLDAALSAESTNARVAAELARSVSDEDPERSRELERRARRFVSRAADPLRSDSRARAGGG